MDKTLILLKDLHCTMQYMYEGTVTISFYTSESNAKIWEIRGPKKDLVVMLHYQNDCTDTDKISDSGDTILIKEESTDIGNKYHLNECSSDVNCTDVAEVEVHKNMISDDDDLTCQSAIDYASQSTIYNTTSNEKAVVVQSSTCSNISNEETISHSNTYIESSADMDIAADKRTSAVFDSTCHLVNDYTTQLTRCNSTVSEEAVPVLDMVCSMTKNVSGEFGYSQSFKSESQHEIKTNDGRSFHSNCEIVSQNNINLGDTPLCWNTEQDSQTSLILRDCKTYFNLHDVTPIIEEDAVEDKMLQLLQNTGTGKEPAKELQNELNCESNDTNTSHMEGLVGEMGKLKDCFVLLLLEPLDITNLKINYLPAALEPNTYSLTGQVVTDDRISISVECFKCRNNFLMKYNVESFKQIQTVDNIHLCPCCESSQCNKKFTQKSIPIQYKFIHSGVKPYKCSQCYKQFSKRCYLQQHELIHVGIKSYEYSQCHKKFYQKCYLERHKLFHSEVKPYECSQCNKKFNWKSHLEQHKLVHSRVKPHECPQCNKKFAHKHKLVQHQLIHSGVKPHECSQCHKKFYRKYYFERHKLIHSEVKPHECSQCNKKFKRKCHLEQHKLNHSGVKPHECPQCNKKFKRKCHLEQHKLIHSGVKAHECCQCNKKFTRKESLVQHKLTHSEV